ncbi:MAG: hypothetical protein K6G61_10275 [Solobacterium sp.]|nr:hypothetical protein [Solobacterium sp.]
MFNVSEYGHSFHGKTILVIQLDDRTAFSILESVRRDSYAYSFQTDGDIPSCRPDAVYFQSEESWYGLRFHDYRSTDHTMSMQIHVVKPMFMATAQLLKYEQVCSLSSSENEHRVCYFVLRESDDII